MKAIKNVRFTSIDLPVLRVHYSDSPERDPSTPAGRQWKEKARKDYTSQADWDREQEIIHTAGGGELLFSAILDKYARKIVITDPNWKPDPAWSGGGGFDHGGTNPTAFERMYVDFYGCIYVCGEYYMPSLDPLNKLGPAHHAAHLRRMPGFKGIDIYADPSIFGKTQAQTDGTYKSVNELYQEAGIENFRIARNDELLGMERILDHWRDLDHIEPSLKIVCRYPYDRMAPGFYPYDCPNLLWELKRARRAKLTATQLMTRNPTEAVVDKDNHGRDALKYYLLSRPEATEKPTDMRIKERTQGMDTMNAMLIRAKMLADERKASESVSRSSVAKRRASQFRTKLPALR